MCGLAFSGCPAIFRVSSHQAAFIGLRRICHWDSLFDTRPKYQQFRIAIVSPTPPINEAPITHLPSLSLNGVRIIVSAYLRASFSLSAE